MPKITDEKKEARRQQVLEAAWRCFQRQGLQATTMHDIIRECGLSAGAVYLYFPSKEALIESAVVGSLTQLSDRIMPAVDPRLAPAELVEELARKVDQFSERDTHDMRRIALLGWAETQRDPKLKATMANYYQGFRAALRSYASARGADQADAEALARTLLSAVFGHVVQSALLGDTRPGDLRSGLEQLGAP